MAPKNIPVKYGRFLLKDSYIAAIIKKAADTCPKYQDDPTEDKNQMMLPTDVKSPMKISNLRSFLNIQDTIIVRATIPAPSKWAKYCC